MAKAPDDHAIDKWSDLMSKWDAGNQKYESAAAKLHNSLGDNQAELAAAVSMAMQELKDLKREIDLLIRSARHNRLQLPGTLVMGTLEPKQSELQSDASPRDSAGSVRTRP